MTSTEWAALVRPPHARQWTVIGTIEVPAPGRYQILARNGGSPLAYVALDGLAAGELVEGDRLPVHECDICSCCGECGCTGRGWCAACDRYRRWAEAARPQLSAYLAKVGHEGWFVQTNGRTHAVGCSSLKRNVDDVIAGLDEGCQHRGFHEARLPTPARGQELGARRRCRICCPDVIVPDGRASVRGTDGSPAGQPRPSRANQRNCHAAACFPGSKSPSQGRASHAADG